MILLQCPPEEFSLYRNQIIRPKSLPDITFFSSIHWRNHRVSRKQIEINKVVEWGLESLEGKSLKASSAKLACVMHIARLC